MSNTPEPPSYAELSESEAQYRALFDGLDTGFCIIEMKFDEHLYPLDYRFLHLNPAFERETGLVNATGRWIKDMVPTHEQHWFDLYGKVALTGEAIRFENPAEGLGRWYDVQALRVGNPTAHRVAIFFSDITKRRKAEVALQALATSLEQEVAARTRDRNQLWNLSSDIMLRCQVDGIILLVNPAWSDTLGWSEEELIGRSIFDLVHPDDLEHTQAGAKESAAGKALQRFENRYRCKDGSYRWINWSSSPDPDGEAVNGVGRDCTLDKEQALALAKAEAQLRQSQKMEAVGQLTGGLAHDFNNLLTGISGNLEMLQSRLRQQRLDSLERYIDAALTSSGRAAALTHRLLAFSRRQTLDARATDVNRLIVDMEELVRRSVGPAIQITTQAADGLWITQVDPNQLENSLLNLCINARDAMPGGGILTISTANCSVTSHQALAADLKPGDYVVLRVIDTGAGMTPELMNKVFDPFFTTKPLGTGTGLGLSMVYGFALQSGGQVRLSSQPGLGTTASIYLPRLDVDTEALVPSSQSIAPPRAQVGETVLVVDDEPAVRTLVAELLEELGYAAIEASDGATGLKILQSDVGIDLLVTDVGLPGGMNGRQLADAARLTREDLKVLFITGFAEHSVIGDGDLDPGMHVMTKPFTMEALAVRIRQLLENR